MSGFQDAPRKETELPSRHLYGGRARALWSQFAQAPAYQQAFADYPHEPIALAVRARSGEPVDVVFLGVGVGTLERRLAEALSELGLVARLIVHEELPIHAGEAAAAFRTWFPALPILPLHGRFEALPLDRAREPGRRLLLAMIGGSLSNSRHPGSLLQQLGDRLRPGDLLLADCPLASAQVDPRYRQGRLGREVGSSLQPHERSWFTTAPRTTSAPAARTPSRAAASSRSCPSTTAATASSSGTSCRRPSACDSSR